jgi:hypothetical protein
VPFVRVLPAQRLGRSDRRATQQLTRCVTPPQHGRSRSGPRSPAAHAVRGRLAPMRAPPDDALHAGLAE